jgi:N-acetylmuramoyl-L-alanine amidase
MKANGISIFSDGDMEMDLTQTSFSTIPSIDLEVGDAGSDITERTQMKLADGVLKGLNKYYKKGAD